MEGSAVVNELLLANQRRRKPPCENATIPERIRNILPDEYEYHACCIEESSQSDDEVQFTATLRLALRTVEEFDRWRQNFQDTSHATWRVKRTYPADGLKILFKKAYRCHHNTRPEKPSTNSKRRAPSKHTNCQADMMVMLKKTRFKNRSSTRSQDKHLPKYATEVVLNYVHNHPIMCVDTLKFRDVSSEAKASLSSLFKRKFTPKQAVETHRQELQRSCGEDYHVKTVDRAFCPDVPFARRWQRKLFPQEFGGTAAKAILAELRSTVQRYNEEKGGQCMAMEVTSDKKIVIAVCTPLMKRIHQNLEEAGDIVFVDDSSNAERYRCSVFVLLAHSWAGGLPLGVLITTSEMEAEITAALRLYVGLLPDGCFSGRGPQGPRVFLAEDNAAEENSIRHVFPLTVCLLSPLHILRAAWKWLWEETNQVPKDQRWCHLNHLKRLVYAASRTEMDQLYNQTLHDQEITQKFKEYLAGYMARRDTWAMCGLDDRRSSARNTTGEICDGAVLFLRDRILDRTQEFSMVQLMEFVSSSMEEHYSQRLVGVAAGRPDCGLTSSAMPEDRTIGVENIQKLSSTQYIITSPQAGNATYHVDILIGRCSCHVTRPGERCQHQEAVLRHFKDSLPSLTPIQDKDTRLHLYNMATADTLMQRFKEMWTDIALKVIQRPDFLTTPLRAMIRNYRNIKTDAKLACAMSSFGSSIPTAGAPRKKPRSSEIFRRNVARRSAVVRSKAKTRNKAVAEKGCQNRLPKRKSQESSTLEHGCGRMPSSQSTGLPPPPKRSMTASSQNQNQMVPPKESLIGGQDTDSTSVTIS